MDNKEKLEYGDLAEVSVSYLYKRDLSKSIRITSPNDASKVAFELMEKETLGMQEQFVVIYLNRDNKVIGTRKHFIGTLVSVNVDPRIILVTAINLLASSIILAHNHPSGNLKPSDCDQKLTRKMIDCCRLVDIEVLDHLIISPTGNYYGIISESKNL